MTDVLNRTKAWVLDVDGCLMRTPRAGGAGGTAMPMASELLVELRRAGHDVVVCTNASQKPPAQYAEHLRHRGIAVDDTEFVTAGRAAADYVAAHHPGARVLAVGDAGLVAPLRERGTELVDPHSDSRLVDVVVVGAADAYDTPHINAACLSADAGAALYTTVESPWFHGGFGKSVATSAAVANAIGWVAGTRPQVLGKPSMALGETLIRRFCTDPTEITVVGDAAAEIQLARAMGANSVLVLSGATTPEALSSIDDEQRPDAALDDIAALHYRISHRLDQQEDSS